MGKADKAIVLLVLAGDRKAYGEHVHRYKNMVFKAVYAAVRNYHAAEDLTQDVFVDGYIKLKSLGEPYHVGAWLLQMARNKCCNYLTRSAIRFEGELQEYLADEKTPAPEALVIEQAERQALHQAVGRLPDRQKTVVELYYNENVPQSKIAELLQIPVGTVSRRLYDARAKLKKELESMDGTIQNKNFEEEVAKRIKALEDYYHLNRFSADGKEKVVDELIRFADAMPESKLKHKAYASAYVHSEKEERKSAAKKEALLGENADVYQDIFWDNMPTKTTMRAGSKPSTARKGLPNWKKWNKTATPLARCCFGAVPVICA